MARTFIGELILRLKDEMSGKAQAAASKLDTSVERIQATARKFNQTSWGGKFEGQLAKLGATAADIDKVREAWDRLERSIQTRNLSSALAGVEKSNFKAAAIAEFTAIKSAWDARANAIERRTKTMAKRMETALRPILVALGGYTGVYMAGVAGRDAVTSSAKWEREKFRGKMANIPAEEQNKLLDESEKLGAQYPSVGITEIAELARSARAMMGDTERGLAILPDLVRGLVTLQSAKGPDAAVDELRNLLRGIDNAGKNAGGELGIESTRDIIAGLIRAAQVEGSDLDVGKLFQFARRGKIAVPGLSTEFLANVAPAFMQDMTPEGFGTALSSAYQAFVIGSNAVASKKNIARQREIGIRDDKGLVQADMFGTNPYQWVKEVLVPALKKKGVDMENETEVAQEVAQLSRNTNATGLLTRMITQQQQVDRLLEQYANSMGPEAADQARFKDPFVAYKGFIESLRNLSAAVGEDVMPTITAGLNSLANGINALQQAWRDGDPMAKLGITGAAFGAGFGAWKMASAIWGLMTAGTNLNTAAFALEAAAVKLSGGNVDLLDEGGKRRPGPGSKAGWLGMLGTAGAIAAAGLTSGDDPHNVYSNASDAERQKMRDSARKAASGKSDLELDAIEAGSYRKLIESVTKPYNPNTPGVGEYFGGDGVDQTTTGSTTAKPEVDMSSADAALQKAGLIGSDIINALSVSAKPVVDTAALERALQLANALKAALAGIGQGVQQATSSVSRQMNRNFTDQGVTP